MANYFYFGDLEKKYIYIKYFFVYELPYAKEIIEKLYSKGNQEFRKIWKILEENADQKKRYRYKQTQFEFFGFHRHGIFTPFFPNVRDSRKF